MCSVNDKDKNFNVCKDLVQQAKSKGVALLQLPECFAFIGGGKKKNESIENAETLEGPNMKRYLNLAKENKIWLSLGGYHEKVEGEKKIYNTHVIVNSEGEIVTTYRKMHLFDMDLPEGPTMKESEVVMPGDKLVMSNTPFGKVGMSICYDLRFPEMYLALREGGAQILFIPAAFTKVTGEQHWKALLQARAIETQSYVVAAAQVGFHHPERESYGHAMIIDPWGKILGEVEDGTGIATAHIDLEFVENVRKSMPVMNHRRKDFYKFEDPVDGVDGA